MSGPARARGGPPLSPLREPAERPRQERESDSARCASSSSTTLAFKIWNRVWLALVWRRNEVVLCECSRTKCTSQPQRGLCANAAPRGRSGRSVDVAQSLWGNTQILSQASHHTSSPLAPAAHATAGHRHRRPSRLPRGRSIHRTPRRDCSRLVRSIAFSASDRS